MSRNVLKSSIHSASISIVFQICCRCVTFGIGSFVLRIVDRNVLGIMNVRLLLLESTILFLSREAIRKATLSSTVKPHDKRLWSHIINQLWLTVLLCILISGPCLYIWLNWLSTVGDALYDDYAIGCVCIIVSCIIEVIAEPPVFVAQVFCFVKLKVVLDTLHIFVRSTLFVWLVLRDPNHAIFAFGVAQVGSSVVFLVSYYAFFCYYIARHTVKEASNDNAKAKLLNDEAKDGSHESIPFNSILEFLPGNLPNPGSIFNDDLQTLVLSFFKQGIMKQVLTEGERYVMSISPILTFHQQATYDIVNNLGSLFARFVFRPIEENSYFYFTQTILRDVPLPVQKRRKVEEANSVLFNLCKVVTSIGLIGLVFGQSYSRTVLTLYGGAKFVGGDGLSVLLLRWHSFAIVLLAVNGIWEGYMFATMTSKEINRYNYYMGFFSVTFLVLSQQLTSFFGPVGFILANCTNMLLRIVYSGFFIRKQYEAVGLHPLRGVIPKKLFAVCLITFGILCKVSEIRIEPYSVLAHVGVGALSLAVVLSAWAFENRDLIRSYLRKRTKNA